MVRQKTSTKRPARVYDTIPKLVRRTTEGGPSRPHSARKSTASGKIFRRKYYEIVRPALAGIHQPGSAARRCRCACSGQRAGMALVRIRSADCRRHRCWHPGRITRNKQQYIVRQSARNSPSSPIINRPKVPHRHTGNTRRSKDHLPQPERFEDYDDPG